MSATMERPSTAIAQHARLSEQVGRDEDEVWYLTRTLIPALHRRVIAGDASARDEIAAHRTRIRDLEADIALGKQGLAELEDLVAEEHATARAAERRVALKTVARMAAQRQQIADELSELMERLPGLAKRYDQALQAEKNVAFPHLSIDAAMNHQQRAATELMAAKIGHYRLAGDHDSPTARADSRTISELAAAHIASWLAKLS